MALKLTESFDGVATVSQLVDGVPSSTAEPAVGKWVGLNAEPVTYMSIDASGRTGQALKVSTSIASNVNIATRSLGLGTECFIGVAYKPGAVNQSGLSFLTIRDEDAAIALRLERVNDTVRARHFPAGGAGSVAFTTAAILSTSAWSYLEVRFLLADAGGVITLHHNGIQVGTFSGDTKRSTATSLERVLVGQDGTALDAINDMWDDVYILDAADSGVAGAPNNNFLGPSKVHCLFPDGNGNSSQFVGSDGNSVDNYALVNEQSVNDATYVESTSDGDKDTYAFDDLPALTGVVVGVCLMAKAARLNAGDPKNLVAVARLAAAEVDSATLTLQTTLLRREGVFEATPAGNQWTEADVNAAELGYKQTDA